MIFRRWTTPGELMDKWRCWPFQLAEAWLNGLPVYSSINGVRVDPGSSCLECTSGSINGGKACDDELCLHHWTYAGRCDEDYYRADIGTIGQRIASGAFTFDLDEVEDFEQAHGVRIWTQPERAAANTGTLTETPHAAGITGAMIEKRWQGYGLDLLAALRGGELTPVDKIVAAGETCGPRRTKEMDPCLYCEDGPVGCKCEHLEQDDFCTHWSHEGRMFRVRHAIFLRHEVIGYELSKGVNIPANVRDAGQDHQEAAKALLPAKSISLENSEKQEPPSNPQEELMLEELTRAALLLAGQAQAQGRALIRDELRQHLVESTSFRDHQITDRIFKRVWKSMPEDSKNKGGRPRKAE